MLPVGYCPCWWCWYYSCSQHQTVTQPQPASFHLCVAPSLTSPGTPQQFAVIWNLNTHTHTHTHSILFTSVFFRVTTWLCFCLFVFCRILVVFFIFSDRTQSYWNDQNSHRKKQQQTKGLNEHHLLIWRFVLSCVCVCHILYVSWCSWSMSTHGYVCEHTECNDIVYFCVISLPLSLHPESFFIWLLTALSVFFLSSLSHTLSTISVLFVLSSSYLYFLLLLFFVSICLDLPFFPVLILPHLSTPSPCWVRAQETSGLSPAVGCGRHGEDARARLEVCVYVPAGVLQGSGDEGPG